MKGIGPKEERETIINFNEFDESATVWTASEVIYRRLIKRLGTDYLLEDSERHAVFEVPRAWITLPRRRVAKVASPKQLAARSRFGAKRVKRVHTEWEL